MAVDDNPFADTNGGTVPSAATGAWGSSTAGAWEAPAAQITVSNTRDAAAQEADLSRREAALNQREAELKRLELELRNQGGGKSTKNWPKYCPVVHHDIAGEIPAGLQRMVRCAYWAYLGLCWCMFFNWVGTAAVMIGIGGHLSSFLWAAIWMVGGIPGAFILWYMRLYNAAIKDSAFGYAVFFACFMGHLVFVGWSAIAPPILNGWSHTGFWSATSVITENTGCGIVYYIGAGFWSAEFLWSFWLLKDVYANFRGKDMTLAQARREAVVSAGRSAWEADRDAAVRAASPV